MDDTQREKKRAFHRAGILMEFCNLLKIFFGRCRCCCRRRRFCSTFNLCQLFMCARDTLSHVVWKKKANDINAKKISDT